MAVKMIISLKGEIDCPYCFSLLQWDNVKDIKVSNGNQYITCPECGQNVLLDKEKDYWVESDDSTPEGGSCNAVIVDTLPEVGEAGKTYLLKTHVMAQSYNDGDTEGYYWMRREQGVAVADTVPQNFKKVGIDFCVNETLYYYSPAQDEMVADNDFDQDGETDVVHVYSGYVDANVHQNEFGVFLNTLYDYDIVVFDGTNYVAPPYTYGDIPNT